LPTRDRIDRAGWRIVLLASLGGTLEFYDFVIFGVFAKDIADAIFPNATPLVSLLASFAAFAVGYLARPLGGIFLSHFGDRYGRRRVFLLSLFVMSGATLGMGLVPTYATWGIAASVSMVVLRLVQGFCLGGELPGALTYVVETAPKHAPFVCGVVFCCVTLGVAMATGISFAVRTGLPPEMVPWLGWRLAFIIGGLGGILSFVLRRSLEESPEFARMKQLALRRPFGEVLRRHALPVLLGISALAATGGFNGLFFAHMAAYLSGVLRYNPLEAIWSQTLGVVIHALSILAVGAIAGRVAPLTLMRLGTVVLMAGAIPFYNALVSHSVHPAVLMVLAGVCAGLINGTFAALLTDLFPTRVRFTGVALSFNVAFTLFSGLTPLVATSLIQSTGSVTAPSFVMIGCGLLTLIGSFGLSRYGGHVLAAHAHHPASSAVAAEPGATA
jgi:MFS family permease